MLSDIAKRLGFEKYLLMSRGEAKDTGRARQVILANCIEAVIGAMYLDSGYEVCEKFITREVLVELAKIIDAGDERGPQVKITGIGPGKERHYPNVRLGVRNRPGSR